MLDSVLRTGNTTMQNQVSTPGDLEFSQWALKPLHSPRESQFYITVSSYLMLPEDITEPVIIITTTKSGKLEERGAFSLFFLKKRRLIIFISISVTQMSP